MHSIALNQFTCLMKNLNQNKDNNENTDNNKDIPYINIINIANTT